MAPLLAELRAVADARGKTVAQVAINWSICKGAVPIVGAKVRTEERGVGEAGGGEGGPMAANSPPFPKTSPQNVPQVRDNLGALGWRLTEAEVATLDVASKAVPKGATQNIFQTD